MPVGTEEDFGDLWKAFTKRLQAETGRKGKKLFQPLRLALTGALSGPDVASSMQLLAWSPEVVEACTPLDARMEMLAKYAEDLVEA